MKSTFQSLVTENPMLIEISRFRRRFLNPTGSQAMSGFLMAILLIAYAGLLMLIFSSRGLMDPIAVVMFQSFVFILIAPAMMYGAIAGEREKRTWDLLMVAPISTAQIVMGKFIGAVCAFGVGFIAFLVPVLMCAFTYDKVSWWHLLQAELVSITFTMMLSALTLFFSARSNRPFMALGLVLGVMTIVLLVMPMLSSAVLDGPTSGLINSLHPFFALANLISASEPGRTFDGEYEMNAHAWGMPQIIGYVVLTILFVVWAIKTLNFAENDVKFVPKNTNA